MKQNAIILVLAVALAGSFLLRQEARTQSKQNVVRIMIVDPYRQAYDGISENSKLYNYNEWYKGRREKTVTPQQMLDDGWSIKEVFTTGSNGGDVYIVFTK